MIFKKIGQLDKRGEFSWKGWVATILFGAIILVFALSDLGNRRGDDGLGVAAMVNDSAISIADFRDSVARMEQAYKDQLSMVPAERRREATLELRQTALDQLISGELFYQEAHGRGVRASDAEVRDAILQYEFLSENGRFSRDRYRNFLANSGLSSDVFENQIRRQLVTEKLQELFVASSAPTREELKRNRILANQKVNVRFVEVTADDLKRPGLVDSGEVQSYLTANKAQIEKYYAENRIEFTTEERVKARHILIQKNDKRPEAEALRVATDLRAKVTPANFNQMVAQNSDDMPTKSKGGDLGEFARGSLFPEMEGAIFNLKPGEISAPIASPLGFHIVWLEKKLPAVTKPLAAVETDIARKFVVQSKQSEIIGKLRALVEKGSKPDVEAWLQRAGLAWKESGEFDLSTPTIPKLGNSSAVISAVLKKGRGGGLVQQLVDHGGGHVVVDVVSWKEVTDDKVKEELEGIDQMVAYQKSRSLINAWSDQMRTSASIQRNPRLLQ